MVGNEALIERLSIGGHCFMFVDENNEIIRNCICNIWLNGHLYKSKIESNNQVYIPFASSNKSNHQRAALLIEFLPKYIKPVEDLVTYLSEDFKNNSNPKVRQLLGLNYEYPKNMDTSKKTNNIGLGYKAK